MTTIIQQPESRLLRKNNTPTKIPPHSVEAEQSVLGALMLDHRAWDNIADRISVEDFYRADHRAIFEAILKLVSRSQPFDVLTIAETLKSDNKLSFLPNGEAYLYELAQNTPSAANVVAYADIVRERSILRQLISVGTDVTDSVFNPDGRDSQALLDHAERLVYKISEHQQRGSGPMSIAALLSKATDRLDQLYHTKGALTGVATGFADFDRMTSGLQPGDMVVIAGRPSMGKTSFAMNIAEFAAIKQEKPVMVFSLEMPAEQLALRMISSLGRIDQHKVRTGQLADSDWPRVTSAVSVLSESQLYIDDTPALSPLELRTRARRVARKHGGLSLIVIDYLQLMTSPASRENRTNEISEISRSLKGIAKEFNVPVIALSQLNRGLEQRTDKRPVMSDLRESGAIEQDADVIAFIYRDEVYNEDSANKGSAEIIIRKQRNGPTGDFRLTFLGQYTRFENYASNNTGYDDDNLS
ncbi:MAG: replicative DNA helicase [Gammaproteobacteria bacterium CG_4_10_14_0_8_um_filter_38_16]|nr:MAG: replicative DNA helicase [Gammaproteobacteria bacterium CG_4_10_14_0_8_um_filter_38_16]PJA04027.1 MAG: replicative DNA helicase [Gammaproteobacteria bacterium CG_4_10_14_0_2_um_filter_38_22]PJB10486.1 MAG: replicative DNA helicase [Gammaproteobacteria bacterium CG_4_9_14_3_um_filter_38_9]